jgi:hypothetical protein
VRYPTARDLCLKTLAGIGRQPGRFYGPAAGLPLGAGILLRECVMASPHEEEVRFETGVGLGLVLTHECDIDPNNDRFFNDLFLVCPIIPLDEFCEECEENGGTGAWGGILTQIVRDIVFRAVYLPPLTNPALCPEMEGGGIIYLNHVSSSRVAWVENPSGQAVCSLSAEGLRLFDAKLQNHILRPKDAALWFERR